MSAAKRQKGKRNKMLAFGIPRDEYEKIMANFKNSTCLNRSEYLRKVLLGRRIVLFYRNKSFDEFLDEAIRLRNEMQALREKVPASAAGLSTLITLQEEIKNILIQIFSHVRQNKD